MSAPRAPTVHGADLRLTGSVTLLAEYPTADIFAVPI